MRTVRSIDSGVVNGVIAITLTEDRVHGRQGKMGGFGYPAGTCVTETGEFTISLVVVGSGLEVHESKPTQPPQLVVFDSL